MRNAYEYSIHWAFNHWRKSRDILNNLQKLEYDRERHFCIRISIFGGFWEDKRNRNYFSLFLLQNEIVQINGLYDAENQELCTLVIQLISLAVSWVSRRSMSLANWPLSFAYFQKSCQASMLRAWLFKSLELCPLTLFAMHMYYFSMFKAKLQ